jgi:hypothetical protein
MKMTCRGRNLIRRAFALQEHATLRHPADKPASECSTLQLFAARALAPVDSSAGGSTDSRTQQSTFEVDVRIVETSNVVSGGQSLAAFIHEKHG